MTEAKKHSFKTNPTDSVALSVYNVGYERCSGLHKWGSGVRDHFLIHHIISGKGVYITPSGRFELKAGDTFLIYPYTEITYIADEYDPWEYYWAGFSGSDAEVIISRTDFTKEFPVMSVDFGGELRKRLNDIYISRGQSEAAALKMTGQLYLALSLLVEKSDRGVVSENTSERHIKSAKKFISYNYSLPISVEDVAAGAGVSRSTLFRAFTEVLAISPIEYLTHFRIEQACRLLKHTELSVTSVSLSSGYEDPLYFSKVFKRYKGISPSAYRKKYS